MTMFLGFENSQNPVGKVRCSIYIVTHTVTAPYRVVCSIEVWRSACNLVSVAPATSLDPCSSCNGATMESNCPDSPNVCEID